MCRWIYVKLNHTFLTWIINHTGIREIIWFDLIYLSHNFRLSLVHVVFDYYMIIMKIIFGFCTIYNLCYVDIVLYCKIHKTGWRHVISVESSWVLLNPYLVIEYMIFSTLTPKSLWSMMDNHCRWIHQPSMNRT